MLLYLLQSFAWKYKHEGNDDFNSVKGGGEGERGGEGGRGGGGGGGIRVKY